MFLSTLSQQSAFSFVVYDFLLYNSIENKNKKFLVLKFFFTSLNYIL